MFHLFVIGLISIATSNINLSANEGSEPQIELQPAQELGTEAKEVAEIFLNKGVNKCVRKLQRSVYDYNLLKVTKQTWSSSSSAYSFEFMKLEGGDMAVGTSTMKVQQTVERGVFGTPVTQYTCEVVE